MARRKSAGLRDGDEESAPAAPVVQRLLKALSKNNITNNVKGDGQDCRSCTFLSSSEQVVGYNCAFDADHQSHRDAFGFVMVCLVQKVHGAQGDSEA
jgi:hypothetical protein